MLGFLHRPLSFSDSVFVVVIGMSDGLFDSVFQDFLCFGNLASLGSTNCDVLSMSLFAYSHLSFSKDLLILQSFLGLGLCKRSVKFICLLDLHFDVHSGLLNGRVGLSQFVSEHSIVSTLGL